MARARLLKPDFFEDERITALPFGARILYQAIWCLADREGRLEDRPQRIAAFAFPPMGNESLQARARKEADAWLDLLISTGMVQRYEAEGEHCLLVKRFPEHQKIHPNEPQSVLPPPMVTNSYQRSPMVEVGAPGAPSDTKPTIGDQWLPIVTNVAGSGSGSGSGNKAEAEAETRAPEFPFALAYHKRYRESHAGNPPPPVEHAAALALEREYGADACFQVAQDFDWAKHPNYYRPVLQERRDGIKSNGTDRSKPAAPTGAERVAARLRAGLVE